MALTNEAFSDQFTTLLAAHTTLTAQAAFESDLISLLNSWLEGAITVADLARRLAATLAYWNENQTEFKDWYAGSPVGGPNGDGTYPLTNGVGTTVSVPSIAKLASTMLRGLDARLDLHLFFQGGMGINEVLGQYVHAGDPVTYDASLSKAVSRIPPVGARVITVTKTPLSSNLFTYSEDFDNSVWLVSGLITKTANAIAGPISTLADKISDTDATATDAFMYRTVTIPNNSASYTASVYLKAGTALETRFDIAMSGGVTVGNTNTITWSGPTNSGPGTLTSIGSGWYRLTTTVTNNSTGNTGLAVAVRPAGQGTSKTGDCYIWGAQLEPGLSVSAYSANPAASTAWATASWTQAQTTGTVAITGGTVATGDTLTWISPGTADSTFVDISIHLVEA